MVMFGSVLWAQVPQVSLNQEFSKKASVYEAASGVTLIPLAPQARLKAIKALPDAVVRNDAAARADAHATKVKENASQAMIQAKADQYIPFLYATLSGNMPGMTGFQILNGDSLVQVDAGCPFDGYNQDYGASFYPSWGTWAKDTYVGYWLAKIASSGGLAMWNYMSWDPILTDATDGVKIGSGMISQDWMWSEGSAYSITDNKIYLLANRYNETNTAIAGVFLAWNSGNDTIITESGAVTGLGTGVGVLGLACSANGTLYTIATDGSLYTIDKTTRAATKVGPTGFETGLYLQGMVFDNKTDELYWSGVYTTDGVPATGFFKVDKATGAATLLKFKGYLPQTYALVSKYYPDNSIAVRDLSVSQRLGNPMEVNIKFTVPDKDRNGNTLAGNNMPTKVHVYRKENGGEWTLKETMTSGITAGQLFTKAYTEIVEGQYEYGVVVESGAGTTTKMVTDYVICIAVSLPYINGFEDSESVAQKNVFVSGPDTNASLIKVVADAHKGTNSYRLSGNGTFLSFKALPVEKGATYKVSVFSKMNRKYTWLYLETNGTQTYWMPKAVNTYEELAYNFVAKESGYEEVTLYTGYSKDTAYVDDLKIEKLAPGTVPGKPTEFTVKAAGQGANKALLTFTTPSEMSNGEALAQISGVIVYYGTSRNFPYGGLRDTIVSTAIGTKLTDVEVEVPSNGTYFFGIAAYNANGNCQIVFEPKESLLFGTYIGNDNPVKPTGLSVELTSEGKAKLTWGKVTEGENEGFLPEGVKYLLTYTHGAKTDSVALLTDTTYTFDALTFDHYSFAVQSVLGNYYSAKSNIVYKTCGIEANQITLASAASTTSVTFPLAMSVASGKSSAITQSIYQPTGNAMYITKLNLFTSATTDTLHQRYIVYMGYNDSIAFAGNKDWVQPSSLQKVFDGVLTSSIITSVTQIPITGFYYNGTEPLLVYIVKPTREANASVWNTYNSQTPNTAVWGTLYKSSTGLSFDTVMDLSEQTSLTTGLGANYVPALVVNKETNPSTLNGKITNAIGEALADAVITITATDGNANTIKADLKTGSDGTYNFAFLPTGDFKVKVAALGYLDTTCALNIGAAGSTITLNVAMKSASLVHISGKLVDGGGKALSSVDIKAKSISETVATTGADGTFSFDLYGSTSYTFTAEKTGMQKFVKTVSLAEVNIVLEDFVMLYIPEDITLVNATLKTDKSVEVKWNNPGAVDNILSWAENDTVRNMLTNGGNAIRYAHRYLASDLTQKNATGKKILKMSFVASDLSAKYKIKICADTNTVLYEREIKSYELTENKWADFNVPTEVLIPANKELWAIVEVAAGYEGFPIAFGQTAAVANKGDLVGIGTTWLRASSAAATVKGNVLISLTIEGAQGTQAPNGYVVYRGKQGVDFSAYTKVSQTNVSGNTYTDVSFAQAEPGVYKYAVLADYYGGVLSKAVYSNVLANNMEFAVNVKVNANSGSANGAMVSMVNNADPNFSYSMTVGADGAASVPSVWRGTYSVKVSLPYHTTVSEEWVVDASLNKVVALTEFKGNPSILSTTIEGNNAVMSYSANSPSNWSDGAESYTDFAISGVGEWIMANKANKGGIQNCNWLNNAVEQAFIVFNPSKTTPALGAAWASHSGAKYFASFYDAKKANADMMIHPVSVGGGTLSFYTFGVGYEGENETYKVLYSKTDTLPASFISIPNTANEIAAQEWTLVSCSVPQDAKYIAIQYTSHDKFAFCVDDVTYAVGNIVKPKSFEFYVDGAKVGTAAANASEYTFTGLSAGAHVVGLKTVFGSGVSELVTTNINISSTPTVVNMAVAVNELEASATLTFSAAAGVTPSSYKVYLNGELKAENITATSYVFTNLKKGDYVAGVTAVYTQGNSEMATKDFKVSGAGSEKTALMEKVKVYPNPSSTGLYTVSLTERSNVEVCDINGKIVFKRSNIDEGNYSLDLSSQSKGVYYLRIRTEKGVQVVKVVRN